MAEGLFNALSNKAIRKSAGVQTAEFISKVTIDAMKEKGVDIFRQTPKILTP